MWTDPIYDRTATDVTNETDKGFLNVADAQRIDDNCDALATLLDVTITGHAAWTVSDTLKSPRIITNVQDLRDAYHVRTTTPAVPAAPLNTWQKLNAIELNLYDMYSMFTGNASERWNCGEGFAGQAIGVI